jgi:hypothetical protein
VSVPAAEQLRAPARKDAAALPVLQPEIAANLQWPPALQQLDLQLSAEVLKEPPAWDLARLSQAVQQARSTLTQANDLAIADHVLNKIRRFQEIQNAQLSMSGSPTALPQTATGTSLAPPPSVLGFAGQTPVLEQRPLDVPANLGTAIAGGAQFDAHGWLNELVRNGGRGQTSYVLQDDAGKITHVITPAPGVNLNRYLKAKVGLVGQKGFHQQFGLNHVTAERVVRLDSVQR